MKKNKILALALAATAAGALLAGCDNGGNKDPEKEATLTAVEFSGVSKDYAIGDKIDWSKFVVVLKYDDNTTKTLNKVEFDVEAAVESETEALVKTSELHALETVSEEKEYSISIALKQENFATYHDAGKITVNNISATYFDLVSFAKPTLQSDYEAAIARDGEETSFVKTSELFTVGTLNVFKYNPSVVYRRKGTGGGTINPVNYPKEVKLYELNDDGSIKSKAPSTYFDLVEGGIKFREAAEGKNYQLSTAPKGFAKTLTGADVSPITFNLRVEKGVNIHNGKELAALNLTKLDSATFAEDGANDWYAHTQVDASGNIVHNNEYCDYFYNEKTGEHSAIDTVKLWNDFAVKENIFTAEELDVIKDAPNYFLVRNIQLLPSDIPSEMFLQEGEAGVTDFSKGGLRDYAHVYTPILNKDKVINGNYTTLDASKIPLAYASDVGGYHIYNEETTHVDQSHSALIIFCGLDGNEARYKAQSSINPQGKGVLKNLNTIGNTAPVNEMGDVDDVKTLMNLTGLIFTKASFAEVEYDNLIIKQYMMGVYGDYNYGIGYGDVKPFDTVLLKNSKIYDCANSGTFNYHSGGFHISNTTLKRFGGPAAMMFGSADSDYEGARTLIDSDCVLESYLTGQELYFAAVGATGQIQMLKDIAAGLREGSFMCGENNAYFNLATLAMDGAAMGSDKFSYHADMVLKAESEAPFSHNLNNGEAMFAGAEAASNLYKTLPAAVGQAAPVIETDGGDLLFVNPYDTTNPFGDPVDPGKGICSYKINMSTFQPEPFGQFAGYTLDDYHSPVTGKYMHLYLPVGATTLACTLMIA